MTTTFDIQTDHDSTASIGAPNGAYRWDRFGMAGALGYCLLVGCLSVGTVLGELRDQFAMSGVIAALHGSAFGFALLTSGLIGSQIISRLGRGTVLRSAVTCMGVGILLLCVGPGWPITLLGTLIGGTGCALLVVVMPGLVSDHYGPSRATAFAAINAPAGIAALGLSLAIGGVLSAGWSWRIPYLAFGATAMVTLVIVGRSVAITDVAVDTRPRMRDFAHRDLRRPSLTIVNSVLAEFTAGVWIVTYLKEIGQASAGVAPLLGGAFAIAMAASRLWQRHFTNAFGDRAISVGFAVVAMGALAMFLAPNLAVMTAGAFVIGMGGGPLYPLTVERLFERGSHVLNSVALSALSAILGGIAICIGPLAVGVLADLVGLRWAILFVPAVSLVGTVAHWPRAARRVLLPAR